MKYLVFFVGILGISSCGGGNHDIAYVSGPSDGLVPVKEEVVVLKGTVWQDSEYFLTLCNGSDTYELDLSPEVRETIATEVAKQDSTLGKAFLSIECVVADITTDTTLTGLASKVAIKQWVSDVNELCAQGADGGAQSNAALK